MDRFLQYTTGREPVISSSVIAALILGAVVLVGERLGFTFTETELLLLGSGALIAAGMVGRYFAFSPETHRAEIDDLSRFREALELDALMAEPPEQPE